MESFNSYPKIYSFGHRESKALIGQEVYVQEKVDGSQFSFGIDLDGVLYARSKGQALIIDAPEKMFSKAVETVKNLATLLTPGCTYRGEYLQKPKHNTLCYQRVPEKHIIIFDISAGCEDYLPPTLVKMEAARIGLEVVPELFRGTLESANQVKALLDRESILGGAKIEGVVVKPTGYSLFGADKKPIFAKYVSEAFKEVHGKEFKQANPATAEFVDRLGEIYRAEGRWAKAVQHLRERGVLTDTPKDIGPLVNEIKADIEKEEAEAIKDQLYNFAISKILRGAVAGAPEWYKEKLIAETFA